jgi:hypothetical protein
MREWLATYGSCVDAEPMVGFAMQLGELAAAADGWDVPIAVRWMSLGGWR